MGAVSVHRLCGLERVILHKARKDPLVERRALSAVLACDDRAASARPSVCARRSRAATAWPARRDRVAGRRHPPCSSAAAWCRRRTDRRRAADLSAPRAGGRHRSTPPRVAPSVLARWRDQQDGAGSDRIAHRACHLPAPEEAAETAGGHGTSVHTPTHHLGCEIGDAALGLPTCMRPVPPDLVIVHAWGRLPKALARIFCRITRSHPYRRSVDTA